MTTSQFDILGGWLDDACKERQLPAPQWDISHAVGNNEESTALFIRLLCSRLSSLGYLEERCRKDESLTPTTSNAIRAFQRDAGFKGSDIDGWVGPKTMRRLQQLVSFEDEQDPSTWDWMKGSPYDYPAVQRAVLLRLQTFGFCWGLDLRQRRSIDFRNEKPLQDALSSFLVIAKSLGLASAGQEPVLSIETLQLIFGQDKLVSALAMQHDSYFNDQSNRGFIDAVGRVELWLHGYDVSVGRPPLRSNNRSPGTPTSVKEPLSEFWACFPKGRSVDQSQFTCEFFKQIIELDAAPDSEIDEQTNTKILEVVKEKETQDRVVGKLRSFVSRVWDGIKRVWNWLKGVLNDAANKIENLLGNIARLISRSAREAYLKVVKAIEIVEQGTVYLTKNVFPGSDAKTAILAFDSDLDAKLFINEAALAESVGPLLESDAKLTRYFGASCKILRILFDALSNVLKTFIPTIGWLALLLGLSRIVRDIKELGGIIDTFESPNSLMYQRLTEY